MVPPRDGMCDADQPWHCKIGHFAGSEAVCKRSASAQRCAADQAVSEDTRLQDPAKCGAQPSQTGFERERGNHTYGYR